MVCTYTTNVRGLNPTLLFGGRSCQSCVSVQHRATTGRHTAHLAPQAPSAGDPQLIEAKTADRATAIRCNQNDNSLPAEWTSVITLQSEEGICSTDRCQDHAESVELFLQSASQLLSLQHQISQHALSSGSPAPCTRGAGRTVLCQSRQTTDGTTRMTMKAEDWGSSTTHVPAPLFQSLRVYFPLCLVPSLPSFSL